MRTAYDAVYLSPHLDDAALSCGGQIWQRAAAGQAVLIVTLTAGDPPPGPLPPFAAAHHRAWGLTAEAVAERRQEDRAACRELGADWLHGDLADCIYRRDPQMDAPLYPSDLELFGPLNPAERPLVVEWARRLQALPPAVERFAPLGVGRHVDHQLTRAAAELAWGQERLRYYEDYPYTQRLDNADAWRDLCDGLQPCTIPLTPAAVAARLAATAAYRSQMPHLFADEAEMRERAADWIARMGGERIWTFDWGVP